MSREEKVTLALTVVLLVAGAATSLLLLSAGYPWLGATAAVTSGLCIAGVAVRLMVLGERARAVQAVRHPHPSQGSAQCPEGE